MPITVKAYVPTVAPGVYQAICTDVQEKAAKDDPTNTFRTWQFTLRDGSGRTVGSTSSIQTTPKSKGGKWLAALMGRPVEVDEIVEPVGRPCTIIVAIKDTTGYEYVETVAPPQDAAPPSPVKPVQVYEGMEANETNGPPADKTVAQTVEELPF